MESNFYFNFALKVISNFLMYIGACVFMFTYAPIFYSEFLYSIDDHSNSANISIEDEVVTTKDEKKEEEDSLGIGSLAVADKNFSVVIPKIDVNAPVIEDVSMADFDEYMAALESGVAHARGTALPGEPGNMFLFAHSSLNFWQLGPYATVFNLLNKLEEGDLVVVVKDSESYLYKVKSSEVVSGWNTDPFYLETEESVLTLVTCYPPGTTVNRLVVTAEYVGERN